MFKFKEKKDQVRKGLYHPEGPEVEIRRTRNKGMTEDVSSRLDGTESQPVLKRPKSQKYRRTRTQGLRQDINHLKRIK